MSNVTSCISLKVSATEFAITAMVAMVYFFLSEHTGTKVLLLSFAHMELGMS